MRYFNLILITTIFLTFSCKQKTVEEKPIKKDYSKQVDAICSCVKSYKEFEEKSELLKFTNNDVDLIEDVVALEVQMSDCIGTQMESYKKEAAELTPLLEKACPPALKLLR